MAKVRAELSSGREGQASLHKTRDGAREWAQSRGNPLSLTPRRRKHVHSMGQMLRASRQAVGAEHPVSHRQMRREVRPRKQASDRAAKKT